jgi:fibronectin-binding autotransporter adhesin
MKPRKIHFILTSAILLAPAAFAANTWNGGGAPDGNWSNPANWDGATPDYATALTFAGTANLVTNNDSATAGVVGLTFSSGAGAFTLNGSSVTLGGNIVNSSTTVQTVNLPLVLDANRQIQTNSGGIVLSGQVSGAFTLIQSGSGGPLTLNTAGSSFNLYQINSGTTRLGVNDALPTTKGLTFATATSGTLDLNGKTQTLGAAVTVAGSAGTVAITDTAGGGLLKLGGNVVQNAAGSPTVAISAALDLNGATRTFTLNHTTGNITVSGVISNSTGTAGLTKAGTGPAPLILATTNTYNGTTTVSTGKLEVQGSIATSSNIVITTGASLVFNSASAQSYGNIISGGGTLTKQGDGTLTLSGANSFSGGTTINGGILSVGANNNLGVNPGAATPGNIVINGGALSSSASLTLNANRGIALGSATPSSGGTIDVAAGTLTYGGIIANNGGTNSLTKTGSGTLTLSVANTYTGSTILSGGMLTYGDALALSTGPVSYGGNATLRAGLATTFANSVNIATGVTGTFDTNGNATTLSAAITGAGTLTKVGSGALTLTGGTANTISGGINVNVGRLNVLDGLSLTNAPGTITVASGAGFNYSQAFLAGNLTNALTLSGTGTGTAALGALNLQGNANATGPITLAADTTISHDFNNATISGSITGTNRNLLLLTTQSAQPGLVISGPISLGTGGVTVVAAGGTNTVTLSGSNSYTGETRVQTGVLILSGVARIDNSATVRIDTGAVLDLNFAGTDKVGALFLPGDPNPKPDGTYGSLASSATFKSADFLGAGILQVGGVGGDYATWASANGIPGQPFDGDFNQDGISNGVAYALGLSPTVSSQPAGVLSGNTITFTKGADAIANSDVSWIIETSVTLSGSWLEEVTQAPGNSAATISYNLNPVPGTPKKFARLKVVKTP